MRRRSPFAFIIFCVAAVFFGCDSSTTVPYEASAYRHIRPFWSPAGDRVAFTRTDIGSVGIWSVDTAGGDLQLMHAGQVAGGTWSPDGRWIAYYQDGQILASGVQSDSQQVLVSSPGSNRPAWSPDGMTLAFVRNGIVAVDVATGTERLLYPHGSYVQWFPGTQSVLVGVAAAEAGTFAFYLVRVDADSLDAHDLMTIRTSDDCGFFVPSPDGSTVFFARMPRDRRAEVWSARPATYQLTQLTTDGGDFPAVSPNGLWVVYTRTAPDDGGLWLMRPDGSGKKRLTQPGL